MPTRAAKNPTGSGLKPRAWASGVAGSSGADGDDAERGEGQRQAGVAAEERDPAGADREDDQGLGGERLDEPAGAELGGAGVEDPQHDAEGDEVEHRAERPEDRS